MLAWRCTDGRIRGTLQYHGAGTGRWAARGVQVQNFVRDDGTVDAKIAAIMAGDLSQYPEPLGAIADAARGAICAAPGHRLLIGDFSGVESRVLAWAAGETTKLAQWRKFDATGDPRTEPYDILGKAVGFPDDEARARGKILDLAFGYQGGLGAYASMTYEGDPSTDAERERFKQTFRRLHPHTVAFWHATDRAAIKATRTPGSVQVAKGVSFCSDGAFLQLTLPSGRIVRYPFPRIEKNRFDEPCVMFKDTALGKWGDCNYGRGGYGGLWAENCTQAVARDLLAEAMQRLDAAGYPIVLTVHDEIVAEVPDGSGSLEEFKRLLVEAPAWATDMPIAAKVREGLRFNKPAPPEIADTVETGVKTVETGVFETSEEAPPPVDTDAPRADMPADTDTQGGGAGSTVNLVDSASTIAGASAAAADLIPGGLRGQHHGGRRAYCPFERTEAPHQANGHDKGNGHDQHTGNRDGYPPHGAPDRDTGSQVAFFVYQHADGRNYLGVKKTSTKQFPQFHWTGSAWAKGAPAGLKIPYRLPELVKAPPDAWVLICAGEKEPKSIPIFHRKTPGCLQPSTGTRSRLRSGVGAAENLQAFPMRAHSKIGLN